MPRMPRVNVEGALYYITSRGDNNQAIFKDNEDFQVIRKIVKYLHSTETPDPTYWVQWQLSSLVPKLHWNPEWDRLADRFSLPDKHTSLEVLLF